MLLFLAWCAVALTALTQAADMIQLNKDVWKRIYRVAQADDPAWLTRDDDGDGISNGDELTAGTDPASAGSTIQITSTTVTGGVVHLSFKTVKGKQYTLLKSHDLTQANGWSQVTPPAQAMGTGLAMTFDAPYEANTFFRVVVQDVDTDADGVSDWAEIKLGLDPNAVESSGNTDEFGRPVTDAEYAASNFSEENVVSVSAVGVDALATQPDANQVATDLGLFTITRMGLPTVLGTISVKVQIGGTAATGVDYSALPATVVIPAGVRTVTIPVTPLANAALKAPVSVTLTILAGSGYTAGTAKAAAVTIAPTATPKGTGLTGKYYQGSNATYTNAANFATLKATRLDATVDSAWNSTTLPSGVPTTAISVRWTGQIQPQYSETYFFSVLARQGYVLKIAGTTVIDQWTAFSSATERSGSIALQAGVRYDIQLDYFTTSSSSANQTHLYWWSESQVKQIVPQVRLYPDTGGVLAPPAITSASTAYAYLNQPFQFDITSSSADPGTTFDLPTGTLPPGLSLTQVLVNGTKVGRIAGTPTAAGDYQLVARATNTVGNGTAPLDLQVLDSGNGIVKEVWKGLPAGSTIADIPLGTPASETGLLTSFEDDEATYGNDYGLRVRGYLTVATSGMYYFWVSASSAAELWISNDTEPVNKVLRAVSSGANFREWSATAKQRSGWLQLNAGVKYYVELLQKGSNGANHHFSVGYQLDPTGNGSPLVNGTANGVIPGFMLWKYYTPPVSYASDGTDYGRLYFTKMGAQGQAVTSASGLCTLRLNQSATQAIVNFSYAGLTTAVTGKHIHNDQYLNHPSQIIFDMDTATPQPDGSYLWNIAPVGTFTNTSDIVQLIREGKSYINVHTVNYPNGEIRGNLTIANGAQQFVPPPHPSPGYQPPAPSSDAEAARFLTQATFGPNPDEIATVRNIGYAAWIDSQMALPASHLLDLVVNSQDVNNRYPDEQTVNGFWRTAVTARDQLRHRLAFAFSQIMVTSSVGVLDNNARALSSYYDTLADNAFGNYRALIKAVTLHPAMGRYLDMLGNRNGDITTGRIPNENYAREILQLFSIGLNRLWPDGTLVLDSSFSPVATYDQTVIQGYARVFTGWHYYQPLQANGRLPRNFGTANDATQWVTPMQLFPANSSNVAYHELGAKKLLNNTFIPPATVTDAAVTTQEPDPTSPYYGVNQYDANGLRDLDTALNAIFNHANVGPFICRQLIQRLVTSNPTPGYIYRVVQAFNGERTWDGRVTGVRGDLKEVVKAILLDYEARSSAMLNSPSFGKQREPVLRLTGPARYFLSKPVTGNFTQSSAFSASNPYPHRLRLDLNGDLLIGSGEQTALKFKTVSGNATLPISTFNTQTYYYTRTAPTFPNGTAPRTNPTIFVDAFGLQGADYYQGGPQVTITASSTNETLTATVPHGLSDGDAVWIISTSTMPAPLVAGTTYYVRNSSSTTFQLSTVPTGGTIINLTGNGAGTIVVMKTSGTTITVNSIASALNVSTHNLLAGSSAYFQFFGASAPESKIYTVDAQPSTTQLVLTASTAGSVFKAPACFPRISNCSYTPNLDHSIVNMYTPMPHGLAVGQDVYIRDNTSTALPITGRRTVVTIPNGIDGTPDPYRFTVNAAGTGNSTLSISGVTIYPCIPPNLDRTGTLDLFNSNWNLNVTDGESTTASLTQTPMRAQTVFNFYFPDYSYPGDLALNGVTTPEFQLTSDTNVMLLTNFLEEGLEKPTGLSDGRSSFRGGGGAIVLDMNPYMSATYTANATPGSGAGVDKLVTLFNNQLMGGTMPPGMRDGIVNYVSNTTNFPYTFVSGTPTSAQLTQFRNRIRAVVHLIVTSPEYSIQR